MGHIVRMRAAATIAVVLGAVGSETLMLLGGHPPLFLRALFTIWVLAPFAGLAWAVRTGPRWPAPVPATLYGTTLGLTLGTLVIYVLRILRPPASTGAFWFVIVPPVSVVLMMIAAAAAAWVSRRRRGD